MQSIGILGVGELTEKAVMGLRRSGFTGSIWLSPRNHERGHHLAEHFDCQIAAHNQAVVDHASLLVLGVRPDAVSQLASEVRLQPGQVLVSLVAGLKLATLCELFPDGQCVRAMLSYTAQINQSMVSLYPANPRAQQSLERLGNLVVLDSEDHFELATVAACMNGWFYFLLHDLQTFLQEKGLPEQHARQLVLGNMQDCLASAGHQPEHSLEALGMAIATPGTFTLQGLQTLREQQGIEAWRNACTRVVDSLAGQSYSAS